jgi:hypothetical protein
VSIGNRLEDVFRALAPADLAGLIDFRTGRASESVTSLLIETFLITPPGGVLSTQDVKDRVDQLANRATAQQRSELQQLLRIYTSVGYPQYASREQKLARNVDGSQVEVGFERVVPDAAHRRAMIALIDAPYVHPAVRYANRAEMFLTAVPTVVMSRCVPRLDVEFRFDRPRYDEGLSAPSTLKFLLGTGEANLDGANDALRKAQRTVTGDREVSIAGSELFTSPQMMPTLAPTSPSARYVPVIDVTRPLASLLGAEITVTPTVGMYSYKRAKLSFMLHDRGRLTEMSDFLKPEVYPRTTVVLTYGWSHPDEPGNPYAEFINQQVAVRESYGIVNASYSFEQTGAVRIDLELFTRGASEIRSTKVAESLQSSTALYRKLVKVRDDVAAYRRAKGLDQEQGIGAEVRPFQFLDGAERGVLPDMSSEDLRQNLAKLLRMVEQPDPKIDQTSQRELALELKQLPDDLIAFRKTLSAEIADKFTSARNGLDPFLPDSDKWADHPVAGFVSARNAAPTAGVKRSDKKIASFAKVMSAFVMPALLSSDPTVDVQLVFYSFNAQAGPVASTNIGEFPVEMQVFVDQWRDHVARRGTESVSIEEFTGVLADSTVNDPRSVGYGLRSFYTYDTKAGFVEDPTAVAKRESRDAELLGRFGVFRKPVIEILVESAPARDGSRVMRIHVYDKQAHPYRSAGAFLRASDGSSTFYEVTRDRLKRAADAADAHNTALIKELAKQVISDPAGVRSIDGSSNGSIKSAVAASVPTISYGSSCTSVTTANLTSQHEALLSTVQMLRAGKKNNTQPNGAGTGGLPLRVIPSSLQMTTLGCPFIQLAQIWFVDFMTGTTVDNLYIVTQLQHSIAPGRFESQVTFGFADAYGALEGAPSVISAIQAMAQGQQDPAPADKQRQKKR